MAEMGRPKIQLDWEQFDKLCAIHCTLVEIADYFECSEDTIERRVKEAYDITFAEHYKKKQGGGKRSLRRLQYESATKGSIPMLIWLGKQWLGQKEPMNIILESAKPFEFASKPDDKSDK